ncbi:MAG: ABC transporter ATP-binding protein [Lewinella sp.]|jgi:putative ABC transport system ATP-binding protein|uniref:ABC transporter ATP-binding protein n=1 Tax=Lewinella sp. TaxID=2004506 RepID=UPI003D6ACDF4
MQKTIIDITDLSRDFVLGAEVVRALRGVSLTIKEGEFVSIMGTSGSGKSTLLNILGCLDQASAGSYKIDGVVVKNLNRNALAKIRNEKIGFIFQSYNLLARTTAIENVELPLMYNPQSNSVQRKQRAIDALNLVGLADRLKHTPNQLSGGQQQRVAIARALVNDPVVILADEATGNLDTRTSYEILALFQKLNKEGKTIIFVTHEPDIATFTQRTIVLKDGRIIKDQINDQVANAQKALDLLPKEVDA